jgi:hypothetical protein
VPAGIKLLVCWLKAADEGPKGQCRGVLAQARAVQKQISAATIISFTSFALAQTHEGFSSMHAPIICGFLSYKRLARSKLFSAQSLSGVKLNRPVNIQGTT